VLADELAGTVYFALKKDPVPVRTHRRLSRRDRPGHPPALTRDDITHSKSVVSILICGTQARLLN